jgi:AcrR family transcriptional regulator
VIPVAAEKPDSARRILDAARLLTARGGAAMVSMGDVASTAGVSKALVHYHFHDKDSLLVALAEVAGSDVLAREQRVLDTVPSGHALDRYWEWLRSELSRGDLRVLASLAASDSPRVRASVRALAERRRALAAAHVERVFSDLALAPRIPALVLGQALLAFIDGLAIAAALEPERDARPAFDVLWLALLTLVDHES